MSDELDRVREEMRRLDASMVDLVARRIELARRAGDLKAKAGLPLRNYEVEAEVIRLAKARAVAEGTPPEVAEELMTTLIRASLTAQERDWRTRAATKGAGRRALVVGGAGNMGRWFVDFFDSKGYETQVADPRGSPGGHPRVEDLAVGAAEADVVLIATPPSAVGGVLDEVQGADALVFEIGSLKSPFLQRLKALAAGGSRVTSVHPMWGPSTRLLASKNVVVCSCGNDAADREARALFEDTAANIVTMPIEDHDGFMARVLGLPHAVNLLFGKAIAGQGLPMSELSGLGGPTFVKQVGVAREVASENKDLYYEIQRLNPHTGPMLALLRRSLDELEASLASREAFRAYMADAESFFEGGAPT